MIDTVKDWLEALASRDAILLVVGAVMAGLIGLATTDYIERRKTSGVRKALGELLHAQLETQGPGDGPLDQNRAGTIRLIDLSSIPLLLASGVVDGRKDADLLMHLVWLQTTVEQCNEDARQFNMARATHIDEGSAIFRRYYENAVMNRADYTKAYDEMMLMIHRLTKPLELQPTYSPSLLTRLHWRAKRYRQRFASRLSARRDAGRGRVK